MNSSHANEHNTYLLPAIVALLFNMPFGYFAVKYAVKAQERYKSGDDTGAAAAATVAKRVATWGIYIAFSIYSIGIVSLLYLTVYAPSDQNDALSSSSGIFGEPNICMYSDARQSLT